MAIKLLYIVLFLYLLTSSIINIIYLMEKFKSKSKKEKKILEE